MSARLPRAGASCPRPRRPWPASAVLVGGLARGRVAHDTDSAIAAAGRPFSVILAGRRGRDINFVCWAAAAKVGLQTAWLAHVPEKWSPVFRKEHAPLQKEVERNPVPFERDALYRHDIGRTISIRKGPQLFGMRAKHGTVPL